MFIDSHVHCRDFEESHKETIEHALRVAEDSGLSGIFDMPNTKPATTTRELVLRRLDIAEKANSPVFYGLYIGVSGNPEQIREAVRLHDECFPSPHNRVGVIGLKMFAGKSVGDLGIIDIGSQRLVYETLAQAGYKGVLAVHCEKESLMRPELWNQKNPITHSLVRPTSSEVLSIIDQIELANLANYSGHLHICHVSTFQSVEVIKYRKDLIKISCGVTPHHLLLDDSYMLGETGMLYKVNPPLRRENHRQKLFGQFLRGEIDILETDHAPHTLEEKTQKHMSGIPNLASWPDFVSLLMKAGATQELLDNMAYHNVNKIFGTNIPRLNLPIKPSAHLGEYSFNAYASLK